MKNQLLNFSLFTVKLGLIAIFFSTICSAQDSTHTKPKKHRVGVVTNGINNDPFFGTITEIGLSHEGHLTGTSSSAIHITYVTNNNNATGITIRPDIRFYVKKKAILDEGFYISMGALYNYMAGNLGGRESTVGYVEMHRVGLALGIGYQHTFSNRLFLNVGLNSAITMGMYHDDTVSNGLWYSEAKTHPLHSLDTFIFRVGYLF